MNTAKLLRKNSNIELIKDYSAVLLLFPTIVAGMHQFGILVSINIDLITFFSVTSLAKDGIIFTFLCLMLFIISYLYRAAITRYYYKKYRKSLPFINWISALVGLSLLSVSKYFLLENYAYTILFISGFLYLNNAVFIKKDIFSVLGIYFGQTLLVLILNSSAVQFQKQGIKNIENITKKVKKKYKSSELLYYNDEYLFYSLKKFNPRDKEKDVLVVKMEEIFNKDFEIE